MYTCIPEFSPHLLYFQEEMQIVISFNSMLTSITIKYNHCKEIHNACSTNLCFLLYIKTQLLFQLGVAEIEEKK